MRKLVALRPMRSLSKPTRLFAVIFLISFVGLARESHAVLSGSLMQTAPVLQPGRFEVKGQLDFPIEDGDVGVNFLPHFRTGIVDYFWDLDIYLGTGTTDFQIGAQTKFNLLPDIEGQVGLSFLAGLTLLRDNDNGGLIFHSAVLVSKDFKNEGFGTWSPYGALQFEPLFTRETERFSWSVVAGARVIAEAVDPVILYGELALPLQSSFWMISLGAGYEF